MKSSRRKKKLLREKILESYFMEDESADFPQDLLNKKTVSFLTSSIDCEEDQLGFEIADEFFESPDNLLNVTVQCGERNHKFL
jgi:hypothetical protein